MREAARRLGVHENTVRNLSRRGVLPRAQIPGSRVNRFDARDVERLRRQRGDAVATVAPERNAIGPELIDASQLDQWARMASRDAQQTLPELIRRLLSATPGITSLSMRAGDGVALSGWDGTAESAGTSFLPAGHLCFEIGVAAQAKRKADEDWENRRSAPNAGELCFVFVTPRRWRDGKAWAQKRRDEQVFQNVFVLDADDLDGWLAATPPVHYWISEHLGRAPDDAETLGQWWRLFSHQTDPVLPGEFFLAGREEARDAVVAFLEKAPDVLIVSAPWQDDALAFIAAVMQFVAAERGEPAPPVVVRTAEAWARICSAAARSTLIPMFDGPDIAAAIAGGHHVLIPAGADDSVWGAVVELIPPNRNEARQRLESVGVPFERAYVLSAVARRSMPAFVRELSRDRRLRSPGWARELETAQIFAPLVLLGSWTLNQADKDIAAEVASADWDTIESRLVHWARRDDPPFVRSGETQWHVASSDEAFMVLHHQLTSSALERWRQVVPRVLLELDPVLELDPDEQLMAGVRGIGRVYSSILRRGIADGIALIGSLEDRAVGNGSTGADEARRVVDEILAKAEADKSGRTWQSLSDVLPLLAEAAPWGFLEAVADDLAQDEPNLKGMFQDADRSSWLTSSSAHTGLLWALETVCWSPEYLAEASLALARLQSIDPGGRLGNRPIASLQNVLVGWIRHTAASLDDRVAAINQICNQVPDVGWDLILSLWPSQHGTAMPPARPRHRDWLPDDRSVAVAEWIQYIGHLVQLAIKLPGTDVSRWAKLVTRVAQLPPDQRDEVLGALEAISPVQLDEHEQLVLWEAMHKEVAHHRRFKDASWAMDEPTLERFDAIASRIKPEASAERFAYLFEWRPDVPDIPRDDFASQDARIEELRRDAIRETIATRSLDALAALARRARVPTFVGWTLGDVASDELASEIAVWLDSSERALKAVAECWVRAKASGDGGIAWLRQMLGTKELETESRRLALVLNAPATSELWDAVAEIDPALAEEYWRHCYPIHVGSQDLARAVDELLARTRAWVAIDLIASDIHHPDEGVQTLVREHAERALELAMQVPPSEKPMETLGYEVGVVLDYLERHGTDPLRLAQFEFIFFRLIEHHRQPRALFHALSTDTETYVDLVSRVYRGKNEPERQLDERETALAQQAWWVLAHWDGMPGLHEDGTIDADHLKKWVEQTRLAFSERNRADIGDEQIGQVLSHSPPGQDGVWPAEPVREIVETLGSEAIEAGLFTGAFNSRGVTRRGVYDGGEQERALANKYREGAKTTAHTWRRTSRLLRRLADSYERHARHEDARAQVVADTE